MKFYNVNHTRLKETMVSVLKSLDVCDDSIKHCTDSMVQTSLRGVDSHGINLFPHYVNSFKSGRLNKNPDFKIKKASGGTVLLDADNAIGHHSGAYTMDKVIELAKTNGIAAGKVDDSSHFGAAAYFGLRAANKGLIGFSFTNADALVKAHSGTDPFFGTNPICFTAPLKNEKPLCLDMATSLVSWNKIKNYRLEDKSVPDGWAFDENGQNVSNPHDAKSLSPIGEYKGFGLGMMVSILCSVISGGITDKDMLAMFTSEPGAHRKVGHFFMALDISNFSDTEVFKSNLQSMVDQIRNQTSISSEATMMAPGDPEKISYNKRIVEGIPVMEHVFNDYLSISEDFKLALV